MSRVALGGNGKKLKAGPIRKMLLDALKLNAAFAFLTNRRVKIEQRVILVRSAWIKEKMERGWRIAALKKAKVAIRVAGLTPDEEKKAAKIVAKFARPFA